MGARSTSPATSHHPPTGATSSRPTASPRPPSTRATPRFQRARCLLDGIVRQAPRLAQTFPQGVTQLIPFDTTRFVQQSIHEVIITLSEAAFLVLLVVFVTLALWTFEPVMTE